MAIMDRPEEMGHTNYAVARKDEMILPQLRTACQPIKQITWAAEEEGSCASW